MINGVLYTVDRGIGKVTSAYKRRRYGKRTQPFICTGEKGLRFELVPNETIDADIATYGIYERRLLRYLDARLSNDAVILDIGANIGNHALYLSAPTREIHCFEPNPSAWNRLEHNIGLNAPRNIRVHRFGLGDQDATALFQENISGNLGASGFVADGDAIATGFRPVELPIRHADRAIADLELARIDFIKMDVEGLESRIIPAMGDAITRHRPLIAFEYSGHSASDIAWQTIVASLPGYRVCEPCFAPEGSVLSKLSWNLAHAGQPQLRVIGRPEHKWYECLLAEPL